MRKGQKILKPTEAEVDYIRRMCNASSDEAMAVVLRRMTGNELWNRRRVEHVRRARGIYKTAVILPHKMREGVVRIHRHKDGRKVKRIKINGVWIRYARYVWEKANGPIPKGHHIVHADRNQLNCALPNLRCLDKAGYVKHAQQGLRYDERYRANVGAAVSKAKQYAKRKKAAEIYLAHKPYEFAT